MTGSGLEKSVLDISRPRATPQPNSPHPFFLLNFHNPRQPRKRRCVSSTDVLLWVYLFSMYPLETPMPTTTIRLPEDLKARVAAAAKRAGMTPHGFILEAIAEKTEQENLRADFDAVAEERYARIVASGKTIPWEKMRGYLEERLAGKAAKRPAARKLAR